MVVTGSKRQGDLSSPSINPSEPALKLYLFAKIATTLSFFQKAVLGSAPTFYQSQVGSFAGSGGGFQAVVGQESPCGLLGVFGFASHPVAV